jgi:hypothetical protein
MKATSNTSITSTSGRDIDFTEFRIGFAAMESHDPSSAGHVESCTGHGRHTAGRPGIAVLGDRGRYGLQILVTPQSRGIAWRSPRGAARSAGSGAGRSCRRAPQEWRPRYRLRLPSSASPMGPATTSRLAEPLLPDVLQCPHDADHGGRTVRRTGLCCRCLRACSARPPVSGARRAVACAGDAPTGVHVCRRCPRLPLAWVAIATKPARAIAHIGVRSTQSQAACDRGGCLPELAGIQAIAAPDMRELECLEQNDRPGQHGKDQQNPRTPP